MRYAIWKDEELFKNWVLNNCEFEINENSSACIPPQSVEDNDGVEIRIRFHMDKLLSFATINRISLQCVSLVLTNTVIMTLMRASWTIPTRNLSDTKKANILPHLIVMLVETSRTDC